MVGVRKPQREFYELACELASTSPDRVVFLDDLGVNQKPARALGMTTIKVVDAEFLSNGVSMARATCQLLRRTEAPEGQVWSPPRWEVPAPDAIESQAALGGMWAMKPITGEVFSQLAGIVA